MKFRYLCKINISYSETKMGGELWIFFKKLSPPPRRRTHRSTPMITRFVIFICSVFICILLFYTLLFILTVHNFVWYVKSSSEVAVWVITTVWIILTLNVLSKLNNYLTTVTNNKCIQLVEFKKSYIHFSQSLLKIKIKLLNTFPYSWTLFIFRNIKYVYKYQ